MEAGGGLRLPRRPAPGDVAVREPRPYDVLADLLAYPDESFPTRVAEARSVLAVHAPAAAAALEPLAGRAAEGDASSWEELYTRTFDWSPERALELGWHLYGEQYDRGAFLVRMRAHLRAAGVEEGAELPDHLGTVLRLLPRLPDADAQRLAAEAVVPALAKVQAGFGDEPNPYRDVLRAVAALVPPAPAVTPEGAPCLP